MKLPFVIRDRNVQGNFDKLAKLLIDTNERITAIRFGAQTLTFPGGSPLTDTPAVTHGLPRTPTVVMVSTSSPGVHVFWGTLGASTFTVGGQTIDGSSPGAASTITAHWLAVG